MKKQVQKVGIGALNLSVPGDRVGEGEFIALQDFRPDRVGVLRSRLREGAAVAAGLATPVHTLYFEGARRYQGGGPNLYRDGVKIQGGLDGAPVALVPFDGFTWVMNRSFQAKDDGTQLRAWLPAPPSSAPVAVADATSLPSQTGAYTWYVTFDTAAAHESDLSPALAAITLAGTGATLTAVALSSDPQVTMRHIYRAGGALDQLYRVGTIADNVTTTFHDDMTDLNAVQFGINHHGDHQAPPAARGVVLYNDKLIAYSSAAMPNAFWWTGADTPWYFPGQGLSEGNWAPCGDDFEDILAMSAKPRLMLIYKQRSIWRLVGDPDDNSGVLECINSELGIVGESAWCAAGANDYMGGYDYIATAEGIYKIGPYTGCTPVTGKLAPLFRGEYITLPGAAPAAPLNQTPAILATATLGYRHGRLYFSYADAGSQEPNATLVYDEATQRWASDSRGFTSFCSEGETGALMGGLGASEVPLEAALTGTAANLIATTGYLDQGLADSLKGYPGIGVEHNTGGATLQVSALLNYGQQTLPLGAIQSTARTVTTFPIQDPSGQENVEAANIAIRITGQALTEASVYGFQVHWYPGPFSGRGYDSGITDFGSPKIKQANQLHLTIDASAPVHWQLWAALGDILISLGEGDIAVTEPGKRSVPIPLAALREGRIWRLALSSSQAFRLYGAGLSIRPIGLFLPAGATFPLVPSELGTKAIKLLHRLQATFDGCLSVSVSTDLPGGILRPRVAQKIPAQPAVTPLALPLAAPANAGMPPGSAGEYFGTLGEQTLDVMLPRNSRGRLIGVTLVALLDTRVYSARIQHKPIGAVESGAWGWAPLPIEATPEMFAFAPFPGVE